MARYSAWALDLGTTNSRLSAWDRERDQPMVLALPGIARAADSDDEWRAGRAVPSAVEVLDSPTALARLSDLPGLRRYCRWGRLAWIGQSALARNEARSRPGFSPGFKGALARSPYGSLAQLGGRPLGARRMGYLFLRELFRAAKRATGQTIRELTIPTPVDSFETYRAELGALCAALGIPKVRFLDEPVAAAIGYGLGLSRVQRVLVVDFGGGTLDVALVRLSPSSARPGESEVLGKSGRVLGGNTVDTWLVEEICRRCDYDIFGSDDHDAVMWRRLLALEACRVKEALYFEKSATFFLLPPEDLRRFGARLRTGPLPPVELTTQDLTALIEARGLYRDVAKTVDEAMAMAGVGEESVEHVLLVGGSTLLPKVFRMFEERFGRDKVRAWQPFEAVANGACVCAADRIAPVDFIVHDYALLTHDLDTQEPQTTIIVPHGTRIPTPPDFWKRSLVPTCSLGRPESVFKLIVCEVSAAGREAQVAFDETGRVQRLGEVHGGQPVVVKLNATNPTLGILRPPQEPADRRPRLDVSFGVSEDRWLCATVFDLLSRKRLLDAEPVVRLL